jgi:leucine dehydrogenase
MDALIKEWDGESVIFRFDRKTDCWIIIAIHSTQLGPAIGGTRMKPYPNVEAALMDAMRLARGMTYKWAAAGIDGGGGKAVITASSDLNAQVRQDILRRFGGYIQQLKGFFLTGPDLGTTSEDMDIIAEQGDPYVFCKTPASGGTGNPGIFTARGVFTSIQVAAEKLFGDSDLAGKHILLQGVGSVGGELVKLLLEARAEVRFSDVNEDAIRDFRDEFGLQYISPDLIYDTSCDIFVPCAVGGILNEKTIPRLHCKAIAGAANNQLAKPEDAGRLEKRQILYVPDFISNSGGIIGVISMETKGMSRKDAEGQIVRLIKTNLLRVFERSEKEGISTDEAAQHLARERLVKPT